MTTTKNAGAACPPTVGYIEKGYVTLPQGQVHFRRVQGPGSPVVFLHRTPSSSMSFELMLRRMSGRRAAVAMDTPGFGASFDPQGDPVAADYGAWLLAAADALRLDAFHLCGHHTGTHFAAEICQAAPGRIRSLTLSGVLYASEAERLERQSKLTTPPSPDLEGAYLDATWKLVRRLFEPLGFSRLTAEYLDAVRSLEGRRQAFGAISRQDFPRLLQSLTLPVRIIQSEDDPLDGMLSAVERDNPSIIIERIGRAGLLAPELQSEAFTTGLLAFVESVELSGRSAT